MGRLVVRFALAALVCALVGAVPVSVHASGPPPLLVLTAHVDNDFTIELFDPDGVELDGRELPSRRVRRAGRRQLDLPQLPPRRRRDSAVPGPDRPDGLQHLRREHRARELANRLPARDGHVQVRSAFRHEEGLHGRRATAAASTCHATPPATSTAATIRRVRPPPPLAAVHLHRAVPPARPSSPWPTASSTQSALTVPPGTTVCWTNGGAHPHTVTSDPVPPSPSTQSTWLRARLSRYTFANVGVFGYHCSYHESWG